MNKSIENQFAKIFKEFAGSIFRYIYFKVSDYELAQDITEETFIRYWEVLKKNKIDNHKALLYLIAKGLIVDFYRKKKNNKKVSLENIDERLLGKFDTTEEAIAQIQELEAIYLKIKKLKKDYQDILFLHYVEDLTIKEIAFIQKKKENAIRVFLHRALKELKKKI